MPMSDPVVGGTTLIRQAIHSPNYIRGSQGWSINQDGTVDFTGGTFRGSIVITQSQDVLIYSTPTPATNKLVVAIAGSAGNDGLLNSWQAGLNLYDSNGVQTGVWNTTGFKLIADPTGAFVQVQPNPGSLRSPIFSFSGNVAGVSSSNGSINSNVNGSAPNQFELLGIGGPTTTADPDGSNVTLLLVGGAPPAAGSASGIFQWADTPAGTTVLGQWDNNGFHVYMGDLTAVQPGTSTPPVAETWHAPTLLNGWVNFGAPWQTMRYRKEGVGPAGIVRLDGMIKGGTYTNGTTLFTLPAGYIPVNSQRFVCQADSPTTGANMYELDITSVTGNVVLQSIEGAAPGFLTFQGLTFALD